ncbi:MAG: hypothetical protein AB7G39_14960 [Alphaproteobacteria bacterium]
MRGLLRSVLLSSGALALMAGTALAQTAPAATPPVEEAFEPGRFQLMDATPILPDGKAGNRATMMVDTEFGRSWVLTRETGGRLIWERVWVKKSDNVPDDSLRRPQPVR